MTLAKTLLAGTTVVAFMASFAAFSTGLAYVKTLEPGLPDVAGITQWSPKVGTKIRASDGTILGSHASEYREYAIYEDIPPLVVSAFVAAEDGQYWTHAGVNPVAIARAALTDLKSKGGKMEGASTITQQVVKNLLLTPERSIDRKIKEAILALRADKEVGKKRILEIYLNQIYLGEGAYGVKAAAKRYFGKELGALTPAEAATLAALPKAPSTVNPVKNKQATEARRNYVLKRMFDDSYIDEGVYNSSITSPIVLAAEKSDDTGLDPAFAYPEETVRRALVSNFGKQKIYEDGGEFKTTIVADLQKVVHRELRSGLVREDRREGWQGPLASGIALPVNWKDPAIIRPNGTEDWKIGIVISAGNDAVVETPDGEVKISGESLAWATRSKRASSLLKQGDEVLVGDIGNGPEIVSVPRVQGAVIVMDPVTGGIRALDGGFSFADSEFNRATQAMRQTGSVFKPFIYLTALELGFNAMSPILDRPISIDQGPGLADWRPTSHNASMGLITLRRSLELSRNESTVRLMYDIGLDRVAQTAEKAGLRLPEKLTYSMALGTASMTPLNVAEAYSTIANGGYPVHSTFVPAQQPVDLTKATPIFDPIPIAQLSSILEGVTYAGTAKSAFEGFDKPISAKTGTTDQSKDAWFASYGPRFVLVVWVGKDDSKPLAKAAVGGVTAGSIARRILDGDTKDFDFQPFSLPAGAETVLVDRDTGLPDDKGDVVEIVKTDDGTGR